MTAGGGKLLFFSVKVHKIELIFQDDECQQSILMKKLAFRFWLRAATLAHNRGGYLFLLPP